MPPKTKQKIVDWSKHDGPDGFDDVKQSDLGISFLTILQKGSPEIDEDHPDHGTKTFKGAKTGMILNNSSREVVYSPGDDALIVVPFFFQTAYVEWKQPKGFVAAHRDPAILDQTTRDDKNKDVLPNGNVIETTKYFFLKIVEKDGSLSDAVISLTSTQLKKSKLWLNLMRSNKQGGNILPMFSKHYAITTVSESNDKGSWKGWHIEGADMVSDPVAVEQLISASDLAKQDQLRLNHSGDSEDVSKGPF